MEKDFIQLFSILWIAVSVLFFPAQGYAQDSGIITGTIRYRERIALPPSATAEVKLVKLSQTGMPQTVVARATFKLKGTMPAPYILRYNHRKIIPGNTYALQASINVSEKSWLSTATPHLFKPGQKNTTALFLQRTMSEPGMQNDVQIPAGRWRVARIQGKTVASHFQSSFTIEADGAAYGKVGCNSLRGQAQFANDQLSFGAMARTNMMCSPMIMKLEDRFVASLRTVKFWKTDPSRQQLVFLNAHHKPVIVLNK